MADQPRFDAGSARVNTGSTRPGNQHDSPNRAVSNAAPVAASSADPAGSEPLTLPQLIRDFSAPLYRYAFRLAGQASNAEDLVQQTFLVAQQKLHQLREAERASAWLYAVLKSCFLKSRRKPRPVNFDEQFPPDSIADQPDGDATGAWLDREALQLALSELPDEFRIVVLMFYFEDLSYKEIAEQLEMPIGTVMSRLSRGKAHLRRRLEAGVPASADELPAKAETPTRAG
jgi:RNA polymerase sigma-70 factor (ECF subfamily)